MTHYIAMSGSHGCLPDYCTVCDSWEDAVNVLEDFFFRNPKKADLFDDEQYELLLREGYAQLSPHQDGAEYAEIVECDCNTPHIHKD